MTSTNRHRTLSYRVGASLAAAAAGLLGWTLWQFLTLNGAIMLSPPVSMLWAAGVMAVFMRIYVVPARWNRRLRSRSRVRPPGRAWPWIAATAPAMLLLPLAMWTFLLALGLAQDTDLPEPLTKWMARPGGEAAFAVLAVAVLPVLEEFGFRGWIQRPVERRLGAQTAITATALLFAVAHFEADYLPVRLAAGLVMGHAVYATRSIWTGVALHMAWNGGALAVGAAFPDFDPTGKGWAWAAPAGALTVLALVWCAWGVRRMQDAAAANAGLHGAAPGRPVESSP